LAQIEEGALARFLLVALLRLLFQLLLRARVAPAALIASGHWVCRVWKKTQGFEKKHDILRGTQI
jgi:hypothetical protein